jgi:hypothetical protein
MIDGTSTDVFGLSTYPISEQIQQSAEFVARLKALSNKKYTQPRQKVEEQINKILSKNKANLDKEQISTESPKASFKEIQFSGSFTVKNESNDEKLSEDKKQNSLNKQPEKEDTISEDLNDVFE